MIGHDALANKLAESLRANRDLMVWTDINSGSAGTPRPDLFVMRKSFSRPRPTTYEIKVSRSDLMSDLNAGKWQKYLDFSASVTFVMPRGLAKKEEIPLPAGVMFWNEETGKFRHARAPKPGTNVPHWDFMMKLLLDAERLAQGSARQIAGRNWLYTKKADAVLGEEVAECLRKRNYSASLLEDENKKREWAKDRHTKEIEEERAKLVGDRMKYLEGMTLGWIADMLGVDLSQHPTDSWEWKLRNAVVAKSKVMSPTGLKIAMGHAKDSLDRSAKVMGAAVLALKEATEAGSIVEPLRGGTIDVPTQEDEL